MEKDKENIWQIAFCPHCKKLFVSKEKGMRELDMNEEKILELVSILKAEK